MSEHLRVALPPIRIRIGSYFINHVRVLLNSLGRLFASPLSSMMTIAVIGIALALPTGFYVILKNAQQISGGWDGAAKLSLYLNKKVSEPQIEKLVQRLESLKSVESVRAINREQALQEFRLLSGFGSAMDALKENPLPAVIVVTPKIDHQQPDLLEKLVAMTKHYPEVDIAQLDLQWVKRLYSIMNIVQRGLLIIAGMLGLAVILIIGNTIRLDIQSRRSEIEVIKLIGGTNAFIRRPFLYAGFWYGLFGGLLAWTLVVSSLGLLQAPARQLSGLYDSTFQLANLDAFSTLILISSAILLGYLGSWLAVGRHLREIEPG